MVTDSVITQSPKSISTVYVVVSVGQTLILEVVSPVLQRKVGFVVLNNTALSVSLDISILSYKDFV